MVSPGWSPHTATVGHTCALAKQWRQTVRIETIAGQLSIPGRSRHHPGREARSAEDKVQPNGRCERTMTVNICYRATRYSRSVSSITHDLERCQIMI
jgi:hypothetical protein